MPDTPSPRDPERLTATLLLVSTLVAGCGGRQGPPGEDAGLIADATSVDSKVDRAEPDTGPTFDASIDRGMNCVPRTCALLNANCGQVPDGCGGVLDCGTCVAPECCGGGGFNQCGGPSDAGRPRHDAGLCPACMPVTCALQNIHCGLGSDGCGSILQCGTCAGGVVCGAGGQPGNCGGR